MTGLAANQIFALLVSICSFGRVLAQVPGKWENKVDETGRKVQSLQIQAPAMTEEDQFGYNMPDRYRCDSCRAVVHQLNAALQRSQLKSRRLQEWETHEIFDETCRSSFKGYGIALIDGENALNGPGLERREIQPGMGAIQMGGETWEKRLGEICRKFVYDKIGEDDLYEHFREHGKVSTEFCFRKTRDCHAGPPAPAEVKNDNKINTDKREKKVQRKKTKTQSMQKKSDESNIAAQQEGIDAYTFLTKLASEHGVPASEYTQKRSYQEWRQLVVRAAGRVFERSDAPVTQV